MKKALLALLAIAIALPIGHLAYARYGTPDPPHGTPAWNARAQILARAQVFLPDQADVSTSLAPPAIEEIECRYDPDETSGTTPKFDCKLPTGESVKFKYGNNPEIPGEIAATRLLTALGFPADRMMLVRRVRCFGCPRSPYRSRQVAEWFFVAGVLDHFLDFSKYAEFYNVALERKLEARSFEVGEHKGWAWYELRAVDPAQGGASRADVDALRLMAVFLAHWDNKSANQRLACLGELKGGGKKPCKTPLLVMQDLGATFGPTKVNYLAWKHSPIWRDPSGCTISMTHLPYRGATFQDVEITEAGRQLLLSKLETLTAQDLTALFRAAYFPDADTGVLGAENVQPWVDLFLEKVAAIRNRACAPTPNPQLPPSG